MEEHSQPPEWKAEFLSLRHANKSIFETFDQVERIGFMAKHMCTNRALDVENLILHVQHTVRDVTGIELVPEVRIVGKEAT